MNPPDLLRRLSTILHESGIPYMLTGSFAATVYGLGRGSQDIDIIIAADEQRVRNLLELLPRHQFYSETDSALESCRRCSMFNVIDHQTGLKIDFIFKKPRPFSDEEFSRRRTSLVQGLPFVVATAEDLIVAKLEWAKKGASLRQIEDVRDILKVRGDELDLSYLEKWIHDLALDEPWAAARKAANLQ